MSVTLSGITNLLKYRYDKRLFEMVAKDVPLWNVIDSEMTPRWSRAGTYFIFKGQNARSTGIVWGDYDQDAYPASREAQYSERRFDVKYLYAAVQVQHVLEAFASGTADASGLAAGTDLLHQEMNGLVEKVTELFNKAAYGDGKGVLATISDFSAGSPATVTVDTTRHLEENMLLDIIDSSGNERTDAVDIDVTHVTGAETFTATISGTPVDGDVIVLADSYNKAIHGLEKFKATTGTYGNVNIANYYQLQPNRYSNSGSYGTNAVFNPRRYLVWLDNINKRGKRRDREGMDTFFTTEDVLHTLYWQMLPDARRPPTMGSWDLYPGLQSTEILGKRYVVDPDCTANTLYKFDKKALAKGVVEGIGGWDDTGGSIARLPVDSSTSRHKPAKVCYYAKHLNLCLIEPRNFGSFEDVEGLSGSGYGTYGGNS